MKRTLLCGALLISAGAATPAVLQNDLDGTLAGGSTTAGTTPIGSATMLARLARSSRAMFGLSGPAAVDPCGPGQVYPPPAANGEAEQIALEMLGPFGGLFAPPDLIARVERDLDLIRTSQPALAGQGHTPEWEPALIVMLDPGQARDDFDCLNASFGAQVTELQVIGFTIVQFPARINVEALEKIYEGLPEVVSANPSGILGGANFWSAFSLGNDVNGTWFWSVEDGSGDCQSGCICRTNYQFTVTGAGGVTLVGMTASGGSSCASPF